MQHLNQTRGHQEGTYCPTWYLKKKQKKTIDIQHQNSAHCKTSPIDYGVVQIHQYQISHNTYIYISKKTELYSWNQSGKKNNIVVIDILLRHYQLLVCMCPSERDHLKDLWCIHNTKVVHQHNITFWARNKVIRRKKSVQPNGPGSYSSTCSIRTLIV